MLISSELLLINLSIIFVVGAVSGLISSIPPGPSNIWLIRSCIPPKRSLIEQGFFVLGIIIMDVLYALIALYGYYVFLKGTFLSFILIIISAFVILALGVIDLYALFKKNLNEDNTPLIKQSPYQSFIMGIFLGVNPGFIVYWLLVTKIIEEAGFSEISFLIGFSYALGIIIADITWYAFVIKISKLGLSNLSGSFFFWLRFFVALSLIFFGIGMLLDINSFI